MVNAAIRTEISNWLDGMSPDQQKRVLEFARTLATAPKRDEDGKQLLQYAGVISAEDAQAMSAAIAQGCERIDADEW